VTFFLTVGDELAGDHLEGVVAQHLHRAVVGFERVVERQLVLGLSPSASPRALAARMSLASWISSSITWAVSIARFWYLRTACSSSSAKDRACTTLRRPRVLDLALQQLLQQLDGEVALRHAAHLGQELVGEDRDVGLLEAGGGEDVDDLVGHHRLGDDLADGVVQLFVGLRVRRAFPFASTARTAWKKPTSSRMRMASSCGTPARRPATGR
jgi:hypothetical protein